MSPTRTAGNTTAPTQLLQANGHSNAYRRFATHAAAFLSSDSELAAF